MNAQKRDEPAIVLLDIRTVAHRSSLSERTVKECIRTGMIHSCKVGTRRLVHIDDFNDFAQRLRGEGGAK